MVEVNPVILNGKEITDNKQGKHCRSSRRNGNCQGQQRGCQRSDASTETSFANPYGCHRNCCKNPELRRIIWFHPKQIPICSTAQRAAERAFTASRRRRKERLPPNKKDEIHTFQTSHLLILTEEHHQIPDES